MLRNPILMVFAASLLDGLASSPQVFDGYFNPGGMDVTPVWMELRIPASDGPVTGSYFYKRKGLPLQLEGTLRGNRIVLSEWEKKGKVTGTFALTRKDDSLSGTWEAPKQNPDNAGRPTRVAFYPASPEDKKFAVFPKPKELILLNGKTFAQEMKESAEDEGSGKHSLPAIQFTSYRKNIVSLSIGGEYTGGAYPNSWSTYHTFDLETRREFDVDSEIDPRASAAFYKMIHGKCQARLSEERKAYSDEEWENAFGDKLQQLQTESEDPLSVCFDFETHSECGTGDGPNYYSFRENELRLSMDHFFGFPHVIQAMDVFLEISVPLKELKKYLKKDSRLNRLVQTAR